MVTDRKMSRCRLAASRILASMSPQISARGSNTTSQRIYPANREARKAHKAINNSPAMSSGANNRIIPAISDQQFHAARECQATRRAGDIELPGAASIAASGQRLVSTIPQLEQAEATCIQE